MKEISVEMPRNYPRLRNITGSIYQLILLREMMRRYYENNQGPFRCSHDELCLCTGFSDTVLSRALCGMEPYVTCLGHGDELTWYIDVEYARRMIREISR